MYYIYEFFNENGELLYVGKTIHLHQRFSSHFSEENWKPKEVNRIMFAECKTKTDMDIYEIYYINKLKPKYNIGLVNNDEFSITLPNLKFKEYNFITNDDEEENIKHSKPILNEQRLEFLISKQLKNILLKNHLSLQQIEDLIDSNFATITINISDYMNYFNIRSRKLSIDLEKASYRLVIRNRNLFKSYQIERGCINFKIRKNSIKDILDLENNNFLFNISPLQVKNIYSNPIYKLIKNGITEISIEKLREILRINKNEYPEYSNIKQRILKSVLKELHNIDININIQEIKLGKRVEKIIMY